MKHKRFLGLAALFPILTSMIMGFGPGGFRLRPVSDLDYHENGAPSAEKVELGRLLFFDKILSGNQNISCATCHHSLTATSDGLSLSVGEGGRGLSVTRDNGSGPSAVHERVPRNAPAVFNLGAREFERLFHDGRVEVDPSFPSGFRSPAGVDLPLGLDNPLAVQAMFPVTSATEMAGQDGENEIANAAADGKLAGPDGVWELLAQRLRGIPEYVALFGEVFPDIQAPEDLTYVHAANAIAAFEAKFWRADNSPFDRYLRGDHQALSQDAFQGMRLFYGQAGCGSCHSGVFQTDHQFHSIAMPQIGPGKGDGMNGREDFGRERVTGLMSDRYRFRTPTLRNVALTGPWGHDGAYNSLEAVVRHHLDPEAGIEGYDTTQAVLPSRPDLDLLDFEAHTDPDVRSAIAASSETPRVRINKREFSQLMEFLYALTDPAGLDLRKDVPQRVPSGLPVFE